MNRKKTCFNCSFLRFEKKVYPIISCCKCCLNFVHILSYRTSKEGYSQIPMSSQQSNTPVWNSEVSYLPGWLTTAMITLKSSFCGMKRGCSYCLNTVCEEEEHYWFIFLFIILCASMYVLALLLPHTSHTHTSNNIQTLKCSQIIGILL